MPFKKQDPSKMFYTALNNIKGYWVTQVNDINTTPAQRAEAIKNLMFLCAETPEERTLGRLALLSYYGTKIGYKITSAMNDALAETGAPLNELADEMLKHVLGTRETNDTV
jgi:hypothetical protein